jgi:hypothetical protein
MFFWEKKNLWEDISVTKISNIHILGHLTPSWELKKKHIKFIYLSRFYLICTKCVKSDNGNK